MPQQKMSACATVEHFEPNSEGQLSSSDALRTLQPWLQTRSYSAAQVLWSEGETSGLLILLNKGRIKAFRELANGSSVLLYVFFPGDLFGFLPFVDGGPYPASAIAVDDIEAQVMSRTSLRRAIAQDPQVAMVLLETLGRRLRESFIRMGDQAQSSALARVAAALSLLMPALPVDTTTSLIDIPTPMQDFAADVGMNPETFSRALSQLVKSGVLHRLGRAKMQVLDPAALRALASGRSKA